MKKYTTRVAKIKEEESLNKKHTSEHADTIKWQRKNTWVTEWVKALNFMALGTKPESKTQKRCKKYTTTI